MTQAQAAAFRALLEVSVPFFEAREQAMKRGDPSRQVEPKDLDLGSFENTVNTYRDAGSQWVYLNMYLAKHIGCWRWFRQRVPVDVATSVVSIGAGPNCCLWGWFLDTPPSNVQVHAVDPLPWHDVLSHPAAQAVNASILGTGRPRRHTYYFPTGVVPPQLADVEQAQAMSASEVPQDAIVLIPFVLNHLIGGVRPIGDIGPVVAWLQELQQVASRVVVVDLPASRAVQFWPALLRALGIHAGTTPPEFSFEREAAPIAALYPDRYRWRSRRAYYKMTTATAIVWTGSRWQTVNDQWSRKAQGLTWG